MAVHKTFAGLASSILVMLGTHKAGFLSYMASALSDKCSAAAASSSPIPDNQCSDIALLVIIVLGGGTFLVIRFWKEIVELVHHGAEKFSDDRRH